MTQFSVTTFLIAALSLGIVHVLTLLVPDHPPGEAETNAVVGICATLVLSFRWMARRFHRQQEVHP